MTSPTCAICNCSPKLCSNVLFECKNCISEGNCGCKIVHHSIRSKFLYSIGPVKQLFTNIRKMFIAALGIEILCILSAEIGDTTGLFVFGYSFHGIVISYVLGFALAGFSTFMAILGRFDFESAAKSGSIRGCCSFLEENSNKGFLFNMVSTFINFKNGMLQFIHHWRNPQMKSMLKASIIILITAETACILSAETITLVFYQYSMFLVIPLSLVVGTFTLTLVESINKIRAKNIINNNDNCCHDCENPLNSNTSLLPSSESSFVPLSDFKKLKKGF